MQICHTSALALIYDSPASHWQICLSPVIYNFKPEKSLHKSCSAKSIAHTNQLVEFLLISYSAVSFVKASIELNGSEEEPPFSCASAVGKVHWIGLV